MAEPLNRTCSGVFLRILYITVPPDVLFDPKGPAVKTTNAVGESFGNG